MELFKWNLANIYLFQVNNENTRKRCEICSKLNIKPPERRKQRRQRRQGCCQGRRQQRQGKEV